MQTTHLGGERYFKLKAEPHHQILLPFHAEDRVTEGVFGYERGCLMDASSHYYNPVGGDVAQLVEHRTGTSATQVRIPGAARDFSPGVNFQCDSDGVRTAPCVIACIYICMHLKDPLVHV